MKRTLKITAYLLISILAILIIGYAIFYFNKKSKSNGNMELLGADAPTLTQSGIRFRDLNKNGALDTYENPNASIDDRVNDLVNQMNLEEKAGAMYVMMIGTTPDGEPMETPVLSVDPMTMMMSMMLPSNSEMIARKKMNSFNILASLEADKMAKYNNVIKKMA
ncbi:MAG: hypothetical protein AAF634_15040 [Bacteroidota bacterium]